jgi:hypothetical protein
MVPALADHVTAVFAVPVTLAVNCRFCDEGTLAALGVSKIAVEEV